MGFYDKDNLIKGFFFLKLEIATKYQTVLQLGLYEI